MLIKAKRLYGLATSGMTMTLGLMAHINETKAAWNGFLSSAFENLNNIISVAKDNSIFKIGPVQSLMPKIRVHIWRSQK